MLPYPNSLPFNLDQQLSAEQYILPNRTAAEEVLPILASEVEHAMKDMKNNKAPGKDQIVMEMLRAGGELVRTKPKELFNQVLTKEGMPKE
jgi:hypothetical protein